MIIQSREEDDGWTDEWTLKDRRSEGVGGSEGVLNGLGSEHQRAQDKFPFEVWL